MYIDIDPITLSFIITNTFILVCYSSLVRKINKMANEVKIALVDLGCECCDDEEEDDDRRP